jgi:hypothetical protein
MKRILLATAAAAALLSPAYGASDIDRADAIAATMIYDAHCEKIPKAVQLTDTIMPLCLSPWW